MIESYVVVSKETVVEIFYTIDKENTLQYAWWKDGNCWPILHYVLNTRNRHPSLQASQQIDCCWLLFATKQKIQNKKNNGIYIFHETVSSHNLETANHIAQIVLHTAMKIHLLTNQNALSIQIV